MIPILVWRDFTACETLGFRPLVAATRADATCPKRMPDGATTRNTLPTILNARAILAFWAKDFGFARHINSQ